MDPDVVRQALVDRSRASGVRTEQDEARALGISGVPFVVIDRTCGVSGAQPGDALLEVLRRHACCSG